MGGGRKNYILAHHTQLKTLFFSHPKDRCYNKTDSILFACLENAYYGNFLIQRIV